MTADQSRALVIGEGRKLVGTLAYSNAWVGATLAQLKARGAGDCSDFTQAVYGAYGYPLRGMSYEQAADGLEIATYNGTAAGSVAAFNAIKAKIQPADLVCMAIDPSRPGKISHVEMMTETWPNSLGHGSGVGPKEHDIRASWLLGKATFWTVRRIIPDSPTITAKSTQKEEDELTPEEHNLLSWIYMNLKVPNYPFGFPQATHNALGALTGKVDALTTAVAQLAGGGKIDMDAITAAAEKGAKEGAAAITAEDVAAQLEVKAK